MMTDEKQNDGGEQYPEQSPQEEQAAQRRVVSSLYRMREIIAGLIALAEDGSISAGQIKNGLLVAFKKHFSQYSSS